MNFFDRWFPRKAEIQELKKDFWRAAKLITSYSLELERAQKLLGICSREEFARREQCKQLKEELAKVTSQRDELEADLKARDERDRCPF